MAVFALVDGNSFYASCQVAFDPSLRQRPVVVLSNNDGCIVAANDRAKGVDEQLKQAHQTFGQGGYQAARPESLMYQPYFKVKPFLDDMGAAVFSSNYELYADMSNRMHAILGTFSNRQEIYSIDESFLELSQVAHLDLTAYGQEIKRTVRQCLGLPVAVGIAPSRTLAKLANHLAKKVAGYDGVLDLTVLAPTTLEALLETVPVDKVWGIGRRLSPQLRELGVETACDLKRCDVKWVRSRFSVTVARIVRELNGESCLDAAEMPDGQRQIISSRSFGRPLTQLAPMQEAVSSYAARAAEKLRQQGRVCQAVTVSVRSSPFASKHAFYQASHTVPLIYPSDHTVLLVKQAKRALKRIWRVGVAYQKATVVLSGVAAKGAVQLDCFAPEPRYSPNERAERLMAVMDQLNQTWGRGTVQLASAGMQNGQAWRMRRERMSPRYTTRWDELPVVS
ncbi:MAG: Y-family DNA polymerase [Hydrogenovibrio sp.]